MKSEIKNQKSTILPAWFGEFGWEVMSWSPWCRARARECGGAIITSFGASRALYEDFATRFRDHGGRDRSLEYPKDMRMYRSDGPGFEHRRFGNPDNAEPFDVLIHARGIARKASINYRAWDLLCGLCALCGYKVASIGTRVDGHIPGTRDLRQIALDRLMDVMAAAGVCVGCSSGVMHLAAACGCDLVVWGDTKTRYGQTLERRYKETWNPQHVAVEWLDADDWQPAAARIMQAIEKRLNE
ncbi:hypothetical protein M0R72_14540 [Candidatus Pacearchaeota archaeon]|nr:hypothetical protein [Candidatus Pacearchaeota archaeon]